MSFKGAERQAAPKTIIHVGLVPTFEPVKRPAPLPEDAARRLDPEYVTWRHGSATLLDTRGVGFFSFREATKHSFSNRVKERDQINAQHVEQWLDSKEESKKFSDFMKVVASFLYGVDHLTPLPGKLAGKGRVLIDR